MRSAPVWENYLVAQAVQASLGLIPERALAVGVRVDGQRVQFVIQLRHPSKHDLDDIDDICATLEDLVGPDISVDVVTQDVQERLISPLDGTRWLYVKRIED